MSPSVRPTLDHYTVDIDNFLETQKDILWVVDMKQLVAAVADDHFGEDIHSKITNVIPGIGKASQIKTLVFMFCARRAGSVEQGVFNPFLSGDISSSRINSEIMDPRGRWGWSRCRRMKSVPPSWQNGHVSRACRVRGHMRRRGHRRADVVRAGTRRRCI